MPDIDRNGLSEEFNLDTSNRVEVLDDNSFEIEWEDSEDPKQMLDNNIERANRILDQVEEEMNNGNFSARLVEVAGQIINSITNSTKEIISDNNYKKYLQIREKMVSLQKEKLKILENKLKKSSGNTLVITDRESILNIINSGNAQKLLENTKERKTDNE